MNLKYNNLNNPQVMGIVNLTPDSFSDGGQINTAELCRKKIISLIESGCGIIDLGAESTAPFNSSISIDEEICRFKEIFFPILDDPPVPLEMCIFSIDTYKVEVFSFIYEKLNTVYPGIEVIWNDVSGNPDRECLNFLKGAPNVKYILSHNLAPRREKTNDHMSYVDEDLTFDDLIEFFKAKIELISGEIETSRVYLDPCFGFSKTFKQNWEFIKRIEDFISFFDNPVVLGVSKKSFFKNMLNDNNLSKDLIEVPHSIFIYKVLKFIESNKLNYRFFPIFRLHNPNIYHISSFYLNN